MYAVIDVSNLLHARYLGGHREMMKKGLPISFLENSTRSYVISKIDQVSRKFKLSWNDIIIAWDSKNYWRTDFFPHYKENRKEAKKKSEVDFEKMHKFFDEFETELREVFPVNHIKVDRAEADDIIATLGYYYKEDVLIMVSRDKDFLQCVSDNVKLFDPFTNDFKTKIRIYENKKSGEKIEWDVRNKKDAKRFLLYQILMGDETDGVPSVVLPDDIFMNPLKSKRDFERFGPKTCVTKFFGDDRRQKLLEYHNKYEANFERNSRLVDMKRCPVEIKKEIVEKFEAIRAKEYETFEGQKFEEWCLKYGLHDLYQNIYWKV